MEGDKEVRPEPWTKKMTPLLLRAWQLRIGPLKATRTSGPC